MSKLPQEDNYEKPINKNIKNIYVHKINSLIKISRDSLAAEEIDILPSSKMAPTRIKKTYSQTDKTALKLEKNRESARKARQRKNLYIKLLQNQVASLRKQLSDSQIIENSSIKYLNEVNNVCKEPFVKRQSSVEEQLDRYLSQDNLPNLDEYKARNEKKSVRLNQTISQFKNWFVPELFKCISNLKKSQRTDINAKIFKNARTQFQQLTQQLKKKDEHSLRILLPFEQPSPEQKMTNIMKILNKYMEQIQSNLQKLTDLTSQAGQLVREQEMCQLEISQVEEARIKSIINELNICGLGDRIDKFMERSIRWEEFPTADILKTMAKIVQFNKFIESAVMDEEIDIKNAEKAQKNISA